jgi:hypothetical protein
MTSTIQTLQGWRRYGLPWLLIALVALGGWGAWRHWGPVLTASRRPIVLALAGPESWKDISSSQRLGILILLQDHLEVLQGRTVVEATRLDAPAGSAAIRVTLAGTRIGDNLALDVQCLGPGDHQARWLLPASTPQASFQTLLTHFGVKMDPRRGILTADAARFWDLAEATGGRIDQDPIRSLRLAEDLVQREPRCAGAMATLSALTYWRLGREAGRVDTGQFHRCDELFRRTLELIPHYPRAVDDFAGYKTDTGDPREAMETTFAALRKYPRVAHLHGALAYPARISGLLEGASRALRARDALVGPHRYEGGEAENTYLYRGDWDLFEWSLGPGSDSHPEPSRDFYRGYVNLLKGHPDRARHFFVRAQSVRGSWVQFESLAHIFELALSGEQERSLRELRALKADRSLLRVPDGEFTFKLAEAFAFLGATEEATETAQRAFAQGFGCTRWFQESPFLTSVPRQARWNALSQHLKERQQLVEIAFPARRFGPR